MILVPAVTTGGVSGGLCCCDHGNSPGGSSVCVSSMALSVLSVI